MKQIIASLDIGSNTIKLIVGEIFEDKLYVLSSAEVRSEGIKKGLIVDEEKCLEQVKEAFKRCEEVLGIKLDRVVLTVPSYSATFIKGEGYTTLSSDNKVDGSDITKSLQASVYNRVSPNLDLVSVTPIEFLVNEEEIVKNPLGMETSRLTVSSILATAPKKNIEPFINMLEKLNIKVVDLAFNGICDYYEFRNEKMKDKSVAIINIGGHKTEVSIVKEDILINSETIDLGGRNVDRDISYIYDISVEEAKELKENFALAHKSKSNTTEIVEVKTKDDNKIKINQYEISEVVYARYKEILTEAKKSINILTKEEISYIIVTGGGSEIDGFSKIFKEIFGSDKDLFTVNDLGVRNNKYSSTLGFIKYYKEKVNFRGKLASTISEEKQEMLFNEKKKINENSLLGKVYSYFFDN